MGYCWLVKIKYDYLLWVENPICSPGSQAWPTQFYLYYRKWHKGVRWMDHLVVLFTSMYMYIFVEWLVMFIVYALWSVSEHDIPSFDYIMKMHLLMKCFDKYYFIMFCFGNKFRNSFKLKGFTLKLFKSINENRSFLAEILGMSQLVSKH